MQGAAAAAGDSGASAAASGAESGAEGDVVGSSRRDPALEQELGGGGGAIVAGEAGGAGAGDDAQRLVARADVVVENMRAPVKDRLKVAWDDVHKMNPRVVYGSISGFGQTGPYRERGGVDQIAQGVAGTEADEQMAVFAEDERAFIIGKQLHGTSVVLLDR